MRGGWHSVGGMWGAGRHLGEEVGPREGHHHLHRVKVLQGVAQLGRDGES